MERYYFVYNSLYISSEFFINRLSLRHSLHKDKSIKQLKGIHNFHTLLNILSIHSDTYDVTVISGGMGEGHIPCAGMKELIRITKPGKMS